MMYQITDFFMNNTSVIKGAADVPDVGTLLQFNEHTRACELMESWSTDTAILS